MRQSIATKLSDTIFGGTRISLVFSQGALNVSGSTMEGVTHDDNLIDDGLFLAYYFSEDVELLQLIFKNLDIVPKIDGTHSTESKKQMEKAISSRLGSKYRCLVCRKGKKQHPVKFSCEWFVPKSFLGGLPDDVLASLLVRYPLCAPAVKQSKVFASKENSCTTYSLHGRCQPRNRPVGCKFRVSKTQSCKKKTT